MVANITENRTLNFDVQKMSKPVVIMLRTQGTIIVLLNLLVLVTIMCKKSKFPAVYWLQIVCLAFNDMLAGLANFLISLIDLPYFRESLSNCSIAVVFLYSSQSASLYSIFGICIHRFIVLKRADRSTYFWKHRHTILSTSVAWTLSLLLCSLPVALYNKPSDYNKLKLCSLKPIFGKDIGKGLMMITGSFVVPLVFTNVMYIILYCMMKTIFRTVQPAPSQTHPDSGSMCSVTRLNESSSIRATAETDISNQSFSSKSANAQETRNEVKRKSTRNNIFLKAPERKTVELLTVKSTAEPTASSSSEQVIITTRMHPLGKPKPQATQFNSQTLLRQRKAFKLLGTILLFLNIFTWPAVAALLLTSFVETISLDRGTLLPLFTTICFNSAVNPILYTATISEFRAALLEILLSIYKIFKC